MTAELRWRRFGCALFRLRRRRCDPRATLNRVRTTFSRAARRRKAPDDRGRMQIRRRRMKKKSRADRSRSRSRLHRSSARHEVGMLLNAPRRRRLHELQMWRRTRRSKRLLPVLAVGPINKEATSFTATLSEAGGVQTRRTNTKTRSAKSARRSQWEKGGPTALATTGRWQLGCRSDPHERVAFRSRPSPPRKSKPKQHADEAAAATAAKKRHDEEAAAGDSGEDQRQADEAAVAAGGEGAQGRRSQNSNGSGAPCWPAALKQSPRRPRQKHKRVRLRNQRAEAAVRQRKTALEIIGAPGFEPGTSPTRTVRATRLRHAPRAAIISERRRERPSRRRSRRRPLLCARRRFQQER